MSSKLIATIIAIASATVSAPVIADTVFSNYPQDFMYAYPISGPYDFATDEFILSAPATIRSVTFSNWLYGDNQPVTVGYEFSNVGFTDLSSSIYTQVNSTLEYSNVPGFSGWKIYNVSFNIPALTLPAGTYFLTLNHETTQFNSIAPADWGTSTTAPYLYTVAGSAFPGTLVTAGITPNAFSLSTSSVPEPTITSMLVAGFLGLAILRRKTA